MATVFSWIVTMTSLVSIPTVHHLSTSTVARKSQCPIWTCSVLDSQSFITQFITQLLFLFSSRPVCWAAVKFLRRGTWRSKLWRRRRWLRDPLCHWGRLRLCSSVSFPCSTRIHFTSKIKRKKKAFCHRVTRPQGDNDICNTHVHSPHSLTLKKICFPVLFASELKIRSITLLFEACSSSTTCSSLTCLKHYCLMVALDS